MYEIKENRNLFVKDAEKREPRGEARALRTGTYSTCQSNAERLSESRRKAAPCRPPCVRCRRLCPAGPADAPIRGRISLPEGSQGPSAGTWLATEPSGGFTWTPLDVGKSRGGGGSPRGRTGCLFLPGGFPPLPAALSL